MRRMSLAIVVVTAIAASYGLSRYNLHFQAGSTQGRDVLYLYYVDPIHLSYKSDKPGIAPDCGMPLAPVYAEDVGNAQTSSALAQLPPGAVTIDGATRRLVGIKVAPVEGGSARRSVRVGDWKTGSTGWR
jgi:hypothetical protein